MFLYADSVFSVCPCQAMFASLEKICDAFGVTLSQFFAQDDICVALTPAQREMLDKWNCLTSAQQTTLLALMDTMN